MNTLLSQLAAGISFSGNIAHDMVAFLTHHHRLDTIGHSARVAAQARILAEASGADQSAAEIGGLLHDISVVIPNTERVRYAEVWGIPVLPEERQVPMIIHQKLSAYIAQHLFGVTNQAILDAIACHTTLRPLASHLDKIVFIADKLKWDGVGDPPYKAELEAKLIDSVDAASDWFITYLWQRRTSLLVIHPWLAAAYAELEDIS